MLCCSQSLWAASCSGPLSYTYSQHSPLSLPHSDWGEEEVWWCSPFTIKPYATVHRLCCNDAIELNTKQPPPNPNPPLPQKRLVLPLFIHVTIHHNCVRTWMEKYPLECRGRWCSGSVTWPEVWASFLVVNYMDWLFMWLTRARLVWQAFVTQHSHEYCCFLLSEHRDL